MLPAAYDHPWCLMLLLSVVLAGASYTATAPCIQPAKKPMRPPFCKRKRSRSMHRARVITKRSLKSAARLALAVAKVSIQPVCLVVTPGSLGSFTFRPCIHLLAHVMDVLALCASLHAVSASSVCFHCTYHANQCAASTQLK